eukprot:scaffold1734_cov196-Cylindrotheca_fusiformis.AAC.6
MVATRRRAITYAIGDRVELVRVGGIDIGILLSKAEDEDDAPGATTHWVVSVEGPNDEEVISEKALGRVLDGSESDESSMSSTIQKTEEMETKVVKKTTKTKAKAAKRKSAPRTKSKRKKRLEDMMLVAPRRAPAPKPKRQEGDDDVTEVAMKTGTLFMYRGSNPRVEFIRIV